MIEFTKNKAALLRLFFTNPDQAFYMQEIGRILNKKPGVFQKALNSLAQENVLVSEYKANARYFNANKEYPLYNEIKSIVFKTIGISGSIKQVLQKVGNIDLSFIYGSYAKGKENQISDIDIVIIGHPNEDILIKELDKLEGVLKRDINYKLYSLQDFNNTIISKEPFLLEILRDKKVMLWGTEGELRAFCQKRAGKKTTA
jgi:predicted nucleotidyltransferase